MKNTLIYLSLIFIFTGCNKSETCDSYLFDEYVRKVDVEFEDGDTYDIRSTIYYKKGNDFIFWKNETIETNNIDSVYKSKLELCEKIIERHKKIVE